jgi:hypothetical protein
MNKLTIPKTDSIQELACFWDTHDLSDFADELVEVKEPIFERNVVIHLHLKQDEAEKIKHVAKLRGISFSDLIQEWVKERIQHV